MATKKKQASALDAGAIIVAFALRDHSEGEGDDAVVAFTKGQRLELGGEEFEDLAKRGICEKGVFVKMKTAVEGGRYSLKPHDTTWLPPRVYEAWKAAGYCEPTADDPQVVAMMKAREDALREAVEQRDEALAQLKAMQDSLGAFVLALVAARTQVEKLRGMVEPEPDSGDVLDDEAQALLAEIVVLVDMLPEAVEMTGFGDGLVAEPQLI